MSTIDEASAWELLAALPPGLAGRSRYRQSVGEFALEVNAAGGWRASHPLAPEAARLLELYLPLRIADSLVIAQLGQSLDGRIATRTGHSHFVTGPDDIRHLHRLRALVDAVVVGAGTVAADDPQLTVREVSGSNPLRVVLDPRCRLPARHRLFSDGAVATLRLHAPEMGARAVHSTVEYEAVPVSGSGFAPETVIEVLARRGMRRILVEGGGSTVSRFLQAGVLDWLFVTVAPMIIGSGIHGLALPEIETLDQALRPSCRHMDLGDDVLFVFHWPRRPDR